MASVPNPLHGAEKIPNAPPSDGMGKIKKIPNASPSGGMSKVKPIPNSSAHEFSNTPYSLAKEK